MKKINTYSAQYKTIQNHAKPALLYPNEIENQFHNNNPIQNGFKKNYQNESKN